MKNTILVAMLALCAAGNALAGFDEANAAYAKQDYATAIKQLTPLAQAGNAKSQALLGVMYEKGQGVTQDDTKAARLYQSAADQGDAVALAHLGEMYETGRGVGEDKMAAFVLYLMAADQGQVSAIDKLGLIFTNLPSMPGIQGEDTKNKEMAYALFNLSCMLSQDADMTAKHSRDELAAKMPPTEIAAAQALTQELAKGPLSQLIPEYLETR